MSTIKHHDHTFDQHSTLHTVKIFQLTRYFLFYFRADDSDIEYFPISSHLTRIRVHKNKVECKRKPLTFVSLKRSARLASEKPDTPPVPPERKSSKYNSALKFCSKMSFSKPYTITKKKLSKVAETSTKTILAKPPNLESPNVVRKAMRENIPKENNPAGTIVKSSTMYYTSGKNQKEDKSLKVTVAISTKGKALLKSNKKSPSTSKKNEKSSKTFISYVDKEENSDRPRSPSTIIKLAKKTSAENAIRKSKRAAEKSKRKSKEDNVRTCEVEPVTHINQEKHEKQKEFGEEFEQTVFCRNPKQLLESPIRRVKVKSEPSLHSMQVYLKEKKPVSESKFRTLEKESPEERCCTTYNRTYRFWERLDEYKLSNKSEKSKFWQGRSSSEPPPISENKENEDIRISSPSNRRIRGCRSPLKPIEGIDGVKMKSTQSRSTSSLNLSHLHDHADYQLYVMELMHSTRKSERFKELTSFYSSLERKGMLEKTAYDNELKPRLKGEEVIDYERWKQLRKKEKAEEELKALYQKLKVDQKYKNLLFCPRDSEQFRWSKERDRSLRIKERSVEDLKQLFHHYAEGDNVKHRSRLDMSKDVYKPLWRGHSVQDVATSYRHVTSSKRGRPITEIKRSLSESTRPLCTQYDKYIGSRVWSSLSMEQLNALKAQLNDIYSTVSNLKRERIQKLLKGQNLHEINVKGNLHPTTLHVRCNSVVTNEQLYSPTMRKKEKHAKKSESVASIPNASSSKEFSEVEKKRLSKRLSKEIMERMKHGSIYGKKRKKNDLIIPRETLGAVAAIKSKRKSSSLCVRDTNISPRTCYSLDMSDEEDLKQDKNDFLLVLEPERKDSSHVQSSKLGSSDTDSMSSNASTVIHLGKSVEPISNKRKYERNESSRKKIGNLYSCSSVSNLKEIFGEHCSEQYSPTREPRTNSQISYISNGRSREYGETQNYYSSESSLYSRSRSLSPDPTKYYRAYLKMTKAGDVRRLRKKFESLEDLRTSHVRRYNMTCKRYRSDPELTRLLLAKRTADVGKTIIKGHEYGDVKYLKNRYEKNYGVRRYYSRSVSPISRTPFKLEDRFMPHINVISKRAHLLQCRSPSPMFYDQDSIGEVEKLKRKFEMQDRMSLMGQLYTSSPEIRELRNISPYLECSWIAHQYPEPQPARPLSISPYRYSRASSVSPVRKQCSILKQKQYDVFANQRFDPSMHRPVCRYEPPLSEFYTDSSNSRQTTVKFKGANI